MPQRRQTKQKQIAKKDDTPLELLLEVLWSPTKKLLDVFMSILDCQQLLTPYNINMSAYAKLSNKVGVNPDLVKNKVETLHRAGYISINGWTLTAIIKPKEGKTEEELVYALRTYTEWLNNANTYTNGAIEFKTIWQKMNDICPKTHRYFETELCEMHRWSECDTCVHKILHEVIHKVPKEENEI